MGRNAVLIVGGRLPAAGRSTSTGACKSRSRPGIARSSRIAALLAGLCLAGGLSSSSALAGEGAWAQVGAGPAHTGMSKDTTIGTEDARSLTVESQFQAPDSPAVPPAVAQGLVYIPFTLGTTGAVEIVSAVAEPEGGEYRHGTLHTPGTIADEPVVRGHKLWVLDSTGVLEGFHLPCRAPEGSPGCFAAAHALVGACPSSCEASPVIAGGLVLALAGDGSLAAYSTRCTGTCTPVWRASVPGASDSTPSIFRGHALIGSSTGQVSAFPLGCSTVCEPSWVSASGDTSHDTVASDEHHGITFWNSADGSLYGAYGCPASGSATSCPARIVTPLHGGPLTSSPVIDNADRLVIVALPGKTIDAFHIARCHRAATCALPSAWSAELPFAAGNFTPSLADGVLWIGDQLGFLHGYAAAGCGAALCEQLTTPPLQLAATTSGMFTEVAAGHVLAGAENGESAYLLTFVART